MRLTTLLALVGLVTVVRVMLGEGSGRATSHSGRDDRYDDEDDEDEDDDDEAPIVRAAGPDSAVNPSKDKADRTMDESTAAGKAPARS